MAELSTVARPYAQALFNIEPAAGRSGAIVWLRKLALVIENSQMSALIANPNVSGEQVFELLQSLVDGPLEKTASNFIRTLILAKRLLLLPEISKQFIAMVNAQSGIRAATVYSAYAIEDKALSDLEKRLEKHFGGKLELQVKVDEALIGGVRVVVGDEVLDASVKAKLEQMKAALIA